MEGTLLRHLAGSCSEVLPSLFSGPGEKAAN